MPASMCLCGAMVIYFGRQVGNCEELIMVQQSGVRRPCCSLIMGFHLLVHRLQIERRCSRRGMVFHTQNHYWTHTHTHIHTAFAELLELSSQIFTLQLSYLCFSQLPADKIQQISIFLSFRINLVFFQAQKLSATPTAEMVYLPQ